MGELPGGRRTPRPPETAPPAGLPPEPGPSRSERRPNAARGHACHPARLAAHLRVGPASGDPFPLPARIVSPIPGLPRRTRVQRPASRCAPIPRSRLSEALLPRDWIIPARTSRKHPRRSPGCVAGCQSWSAMSAPKPRPTPTEGRMQAGRPPAPHPPQFARSRLGAVARSRAASATVTVV